MRTLPLALSVLTSVAACDIAIGRVAQSPPPSVIPTSVGCGDAPGLRQRAAEDRRRTDESRSDHERISTGSRANFFASLAVIANLKCQVTLAEADDALTAALEAARAAEASSSMYEKTRGFNDANFEATRAVEVLAARLAAPAK